MPLINPAIKGRVTRIAEGAVGSPRISGNGKVVVWNQLVDDNLEILKWEDGQVTRITNDPRIDMHADVSCDGKVIAWTRFSSIDPNDKNGHFDVYQWRDGVEMPVATGRGNELDVAVSRDGNVIAWDDDGNGRWGGWRIMRWENGIVEPVTDGRRPGEFPFLTGDGKEIYWRVDSRGHNEIHRRNRAGKIEPVVTTPSWHITPTVTPDGSILLWADDGAGDEDLLMLKDGAVRVVAGERKVDETWARMSADGKAVVWTNFDRRNGKDGEATDVDVYMKEGEENVRLTVDGGWHAFPQISDDGRTIAWLDVTTPHYTYLYLLERDRDPAPEPPGETRVPGK